MKTEKILVGMYLFLILSLAFGIKVSACDTISGNDVMAVSQAEQTLTMSVDALNFSVNYSDVKCGTPTTFTLETIGGSGNFKYRLGNLMRQDEGEMNYVIDPSRLKYQENNSFDFTFMASGTYQLDFYVMDMVTNQYVRKIIKVEINDENYPSIETIADQVVAQCIAEGNTTEYEKVLWLHDWIINNMSYDNSMIYCGPEGALARGKGTCESYHRGYAMLLKRVGIETTRMTGNGHLWTGVKLDGKWYHVDATWDDPGYQDPTLDVNHLYFGVTDEIMTKVHSEYQPTSVYAANSIDDNYFAKNGQLQEWTNQYTSEIKQHLDSYEEDFSVDAKNEQWAESYKEVINTLIKQRLHEELIKDFFADVEISDVSIEYYNDKFTFNVQYMRDGWIVEDGSYYYFQNGKRVTGWLKDGNTWYYLEPSGAMAVSKWINDTYYVKSDGKMATAEWVDGGKYYVDANGKYVPGKKKIQAGWKKDNVGWWYQKEDGSYPRNQWMQINGYWYHFNTNGYMQTGWLKDGNIWYYLESDGAMAVSKWIDNTYYVKSDGKMATSEWVDGGKYYVDASGKYEPGKKKVQAGWKKDNVGWWYQKEDGSYPRNQWMQTNGYWYHFNTNGYMQIGWLKDGNTWYYLESSGAMAVSKWIDNTYYVKADGKMATSEWVDSGRYYVDANGRYVAGKTK